MTMTDREIAQHEARVAAFFAEAQAANPKGFARIAREYVVLTERQLAEHRELEIEFDAVANLLVVDIYGRRYGEEVRSSRRGREHSIDVVAGQARAPWRPPLAPAPWRRGVEVRPVRNRKKLANVA